MTFDQLKTPMCLFALFSLFLIQTSCLTISEGVDYTLGVLEMGGSGGNWTGDTEVYYYDFDSARSGNCLYPEDSWFSTVILSKRYISFYWKVSSDYFDFLQFYIDNELQDEISGEVDWIKKTYTVEKESKHTLKWKYSRVSSRGSGMNCGWVDQLTIEEWKPVTLGEALDNQDLNFTIGGDCNWYGLEEEYYYYDNDSARSGPCSHNQESWFSTEISDIAYISFYWKVSSEPDWDFLRFYIDDELKDQISGELDWIKKTYTVDKESTHTLKWKYSKDELDVDDVGMDCGWVDKLVLEESQPIITLGEALDNQNLNFTTGGDPEWYEQEEEYHYDKDAARSGDCSHNQESWFSTEISGKGYISFYWKVSSEPDYDFLRFYIDNELKDQISGNVDWIKKTYTVDKESTHTLKWEYSRVSRFGNGMDCGWVDQLVIEESQPTITLGEALDNQELTFTTGGDPEWYEQEEEYHYDNDSARSGNCSDNEESWFSTEISDIAYISFYWKVSSEPDWDFLQFYIDNEFKDQISGEVDWIKSFYFVEKESTHTLKWRYSKDVNDLSDVGMDCGWVDQLVLEESEPTITLGEALDNQDLTFTTAGNSKWYGQEKNDAYYDKDAARSGNCSHNQDSWFSTEISDIAYISFYWKVSSEFDRDFLRFYIDNEFKDQISGEVDWIKRTYTVDKESTHTLEWRYSKDVNDEGDVGMDCGWVDQLVIEESQPTITLGEALDNQNLNFITGGDPEWYEQEEEYHYDNDSARSGPCSHNQESWFSTEISDIAYISFYWKVSSEPDWDFLRFYIDNELKDQISGELDWIKSFHFVEKESTHILEWRYSKDEIDEGDVGMDCGWVDQLVLEESEPTITLGEALDNQDLNFTIGGDSNWYGQEKNDAYYDKDAARSGDCSHYQESWFSTEISDIAYISFYWKVSSELDWDFLRFYIDNELQDQISGEVDWIKKTYTVDKESTHTLKWRYSKDEFDADDVGMDCGWVDQLVIEESQPTITLGEALDNQELTFTTGGDPEWYEQEEEYHYDNDSARSGPCSHNQESWFSTEISDIAYISFYWKVSSEPDWDFLQFYIDNKLQDQISGEVDWIKKGYIVDKESTHILEWRYSKDVNDLSDVGMDCGWVDKLVLEDFDTGITLGEALDNQDLTFTTGGDSNWYVQETYYSEGNSAVRSGPLTFNGTWMSTTIEGKGKLSFSWDIASENHENTLILKVDSEIRAVYQNYNDWEEVVLYIHNEGTTEIQWLYIMNPDCDSHAIVDNVQFEKSPFQISLNEALDNEKVIITTQGDSEWHGQDEISIYGNLSAISGGVEQDQTSYMHAKLNGKGQISFYWKVSSEDGSDFLEFYVDGKFQEKISGEVDWAKKSITFPQGDDHKLSWVFSKKTSTSIDKGKGWVDGLTFIEDISEDEIDYTSLGYNIFSYSFAFFLCLFYFIISFF
ncbi:hypothetical protein M0812_26923 [Anaeramoeba flamelloides]|uniref:Uncharacterized protein n=1 Tax=Anaeramoeba flamelloides TaxID=1746091 RepID=A0AAV7YEF1_9EUKA|nr:hypothetical protein M0812_26923 [Anaeramoeba flamelloides]